MIADHSFDIEYKTITTDDENNRIESSAVTVNINVVCRPIFTTTPGTLAIEYMVTDPAIIFEYVPSVQQGCQISQTLLSMTVDPAGPITIVSDVVTGKLTLTLQTDDLTLVNTQTVLELVESDPNDTLSFYTS